MVVQLVRRAHCWHAIVSCLRAASAQRHQESLKWPAQRDVTIYMGFPAGSGNRVEMIRSAAQPSLRKSRLGQRALVRSIQGRGRPWSTGQTRLRGCVAGTSGPTDTPPAGDGGGKPRTTVMPPRSYQRALTFDVEGRLTTVPRWSDGSNVLMINPKGDRHVTWCRTFIAKVKAPHPGKYKLCLDRQNGTGKRTWPCTSSISTAPASQGARAQQGRAGGDPGKS